MSMLQDFPAETAVVRVKKKPAELEGFFSESSTLERRTTVVDADIRKFRTDFPGKAISVAGSVLTMLVAAAVSVAFVTSWRPTPADALSRTSTSVRASNIVLPGEPVRLPSASALLAATPVKTAQPLVEKRGPSTASNRQGAIVPSAPALVEPTASVAAVSAELPQMAPIETAPRRIVDVPAEPPQVNIAPARTIVVVDETPAIQDVIRRYESAYERLDAAAAKRIWPSLDERALAKAFAGLASQTISLQPCHVDVTSSSAVALCNGYATYVGRVGNKAGQIQRRTWRFQLLKLGESWQIGSVQSN